MIRREALRRIIWAAGGAALFSSCLAKSTPPSRLFRNLAISSGHEELISQLADVIIPGTPKFPGARDIQVPLFMAKIIEDCFSKDEQQKFQSGLGQFAEYLTSKNISAIQDLSTSQRERLLSDLESGKGKIAGPVVDFYATVKRLTLRGYTTSEYYMTQVQGYKIIPGKFKGCVPVVTNA
jgi:hypothetical protein